MVRLLLDGEIVRTVSSVWIYLNLHACHNNSVIEQVVHLINEHHCASDGFKDLR